MKDCAQASPRDSEEVLQWKSKRQRRELEPADDTESHCDVVACRSDRGADGTCRHSFEVTISRCHRVLAVPLGVRVFVCVSERFYNHLCHINMSCPIREQLEKIFNLVTSFKSVSWLQHEHTASAKYINLLIIQAKFPLIPYSKKTGIRACLLCSITFPLNTQKGFGN